MSLCCSPVYLVSDSNVCVYINFVCLTVGLFFFRMIGAPVTCPVGAKLTSLTTSLTTWRLFHQVRNFTTHHALQTTLWRNSCFLCLNKKKRSYQIYLRSYSKPGHLTRISLRIWRGFSILWLWLYYGKRQIQPSCKACAWQTLYTRVMNPESISHHVPTTKTISFSVFRILLPAEHEHAQPL